MPDAIAIWIGERNAIDVAGERLKARFVGMRFAGERHGEKRAAVECVFETDDRGTLCVGARDLDGIFDGFGAGIEKNGFLRELAGGERVQFFSDGDVAFVRRDRETEMQMFFELRLNRGDDTRRAVANVEAADAAGKIDVPVAVDVFDGGAIGACRENGRGVGGPARDGSFAARHQRARTRPGNFRSNLNRSHFLFLFFWPPATR